MKTGWSLLLLFLLAASPGLAQAPSADAGACVGGKPDAPVKIEVFSDFQCPACRDFYLETMRSVLTDYADPGKVCVVYREFPLKMHQHAVPAARMGHGALRLGMRHWALVADALFTRQDTWSKDGKIEAVLSPVLSPEDLARLKKEAANPDIETAIAADIALGQQRGVNSTPTFFIIAKGKTEKIVGAIQYPILRRYLDSLLVP